MNNTPGFKDPKELQEYLLNNGFKADNHGWYIKDDLRWYYWGGFVWHKDICIGVAMTIDEFKGIRYAL